MPQTITKKELEEYGRTLAFNLWLHCECGREYNQELAGKMIADALSFYVKRASTTS